MIDDLLFFACAITIFVVVPVAGLVAADYFVSAESTVNAINAQCGTQYEKLDYVRIGQETMLQMCETRQKRIEIR